MASIRPFHCSERGDYNITDFEIIRADAVRVTWHADDPPISAHQQQLAAQIWAKKPDHIFNGDLLVHRATLAKDNSLEVSGYFTEYRFYYAQKQSGQSFGLTPLAVSGLIICEDHVILARRASHVTSYPGLLELVPSGGLDRDSALDDGLVDFRQKLRDEFAEETRQPTEAILSIDPFALIHDPADPVYDIACRLHLNIGCAQLAAGLAQSDEYGDPVAVPLADLSQWLAAHQGDVIPTSRAILMALP
jgi:hypothetical protein